MPSSCGRSSTGSSSAWEPGGSRYAASATGDSFFAAGSRSGRSAPRRRWGDDFYVQSAFVPTDPFYGTFALETSAYARVSDWPSNVVGIHGTNLPALLGQSVSHGCVRVPNDVCRGSGGSRGLGTVIDVVPLAGDLRRPGGEDAQAASEHLLPTPAVSRSEVAKMTIPCVSESP